MQRALADGERVAYPEVLELRQDDLGAVHVQAE